VTYSPVYDKNKSVWPNMSRPRLRNYGQPCGDLRASSSSYTTSESVTSRAVQANLGAYRLLQSSLTCITHNHFIQDILFIGQKLLD